MLNSRHFVKNINPSIKSFFTLNHIIVKESTVRLTIQCKYASYHQIEPQLIPSNRTTINAFGFLGVFLQLGKINKEVRSASKEGQRIS